MRDQEGQNTVVRVALPTQVLVAPVTTVPEGPRTVAQEDRHMTVLVERAIPVLEGLATLDPAEAERVAHRYASEAAALRSNLLGL